ncbi:MAG: 4Fe-4S dicluster domain-containing protein [Gemmatimonadetes bacterium]|nr:4Fe-4S dicluster domain-containing protein [Gemmatimonadota bacterium]
MTAAEHPVGSRAVPDTPLAHAGAGLDLCVHCGFCLQACPTYLALDNENDSPRGRLVLMRGLLAGDLDPNDDAVATHFDRCLGCRGCETACPSGVPYGALLEATRSTLAVSRPRPAVARLILGTFRHRTVLRIALAVARIIRGTGLPDLIARLPREVSFPFAMLASTRRVLSPPPYAPEATSTGPTVALLTGCVMEGLYTETNRATERVLGHNGYRVVRARGQRCCGALHAHAGDVESARALARANIAAFEASGADFVVTNASGCGSLVKEYEHLFAGDDVWQPRARRLATRTRDVSELLAARGPRRGGIVNAVVTWDAPCHLQHAQRVTEPPLAVLAAIPGLRVVPLVDGDHCCGSAGIYNLVEPDTSTRVLDAKLARIEATGADLVVSSNPGCLMQLGAGLRTGPHRARAMHLVDLLDASYAAAGDRHAS